MNALSGFLWFVLQFLRIGLALGIGGWAYLEATQGMACDRWPTINGTVTTSIVKEVKTKNGTRDEAEIKYQYKVNGKTYTANRIQFGTDLFRSPAEILQKYKADQTVQVHYKASDPSVSSLETGFNKMGVIPCLAISLFFAFLAFTGDGKSKREKISVSSRSAALSSGTKVGERKDKIPSGAIQSALIMVILVFAIKFFIESINFGKMQIGGLHLGFLSANVVGVVAIFLAGLGFVFFLTSLPPLAAMLLRSNHLGLADIVATLNTFINSRMSPMSYETAMAYGMQAEIAQERLDFAKAKELSKKALSVFQERKEFTMPPADLGDKRDKMIREHMAQYEKNNASVEALCHASLGDILYEMGLNDEAMVHATTSKRMAQECLRDAVGVDAERVKLTLAEALTLKGRIENATGSPDDARADLEEAIKLRKQLSAQYEESLAKAMADLSLAYISQSESRMAERTIEEGLKLVEGSKKPSHRLAQAKLRSALAEVKMYSGQYSAAEQLLTESLKTEEELLVPGHPDIAKTYLAMAKLRDLQNKQRDAADYRRTANEMFASCFGARTA